VKYRLTGGKMKSPAGSRILVGTMLIVLGLVLFAMNIGLMESIPIVRFWPVILIVIGFSKFFQTDRTKDLWEGGWLILLGVWFQMVSLRLFDFTYRNSWPLVLIIGGICLTGAALTRSSSHATFVKDSDNGK
jgi:hypothetical protein